MWLVLARVGGFVDSNDMWITKETQSGKDRLDYERYAIALAGLFRTDELDLLPTAIGIYAPWGYGKVLVMSMSCRVNRCVASLRTRLV